MIIKLPVTYLQTGRYSSFQLEHLKGYYVYSQVLSVFLYTY
jgi:hypothetical protein